MMQVRTPSLPLVKRLHVWVVAFLLLLNVSLAFVCSPRPSSCHCHVKQSLAAASTTDDNDNDSTITLGITSDDAQSKEFMELLSKHETLDMLGITLYSVVMTKDHFEDQVDVVDVACFASCEAVDKWLENIDAVIDEVIDADEKTNGNVVAVCLSKDVAMACLQSGRWESRNIYYPKGDNSNVELWVSSAVQALGDVNERRFWGG